MIQISRPTTPQNSSHWRCINLPMTSKKFLIQKISLNSFSEIQQEDDTLLKVSFSILTFDTSGNQSVVSREVAEQHLVPTIPHKPIVTKLYEASNGTTNLGSHEAEFSLEHGYKTNTVPVGIFTSAQISTIEDRATGENIEAVIADGYIWKSRFPEVAEIIESWYEDGININSSCELIYSNYEVNDGITYLKDPIFEGHCILASVSNNANNEVLPAYTNARALKIGNSQTQELERLVAQVIEKESNKEVNNLPKKVFNELSHEEQRKKLHQLIRETQEDLYPYILNVYSDKCIYEAWDSEESDTLYQQSYEISEDDVSLVGSPIKVKMTYAPVSQEFAEVTEVKEQLNEVENKVSELNETLTQKNTEIETLISDKTEVEAQLNSLKEIETKYNKVMFDEKLSEITDEFTVKFAKFNSADLIQEEEVQSLLNELAKGSSDAKVALSEKLVEAASSFADSQPTGKSRENNAIKQTPAQKQAFFEPISTIEKYFEQ